MKIIGIIPVRMASTRFPGKPLCRLCGMTMVEHVYRRSSMCDLLNELYVATCDKEIAQEVRRFGGKVIMTSSAHKTCTDRVAEACRSVSKDADIIVNIQGDEPLLYPQMIGQAVAPFFKDKKLQCTNLISKIENDRDFYNPNVIKVVKDYNNFALYFSREPIPSEKKYRGHYKRYKQVCILSFRRPFLLQFMNIHSAQLETVESIDMLRILEYGYKIKLIETHFKTQAVDNKNDRKIVEKIIAKDPLFLKYKQEAKKSFRAD